MQTAVEHFIQRFNWDFFGTLTFRNREHTYLSRQDMWFKFARSSVAYAGAYWKNIPWVLRFETGELGGRLHIHFLMGHFPSRYVNSNVCMWMSGYWEGIGGGNARVRLFGEHDSEADGACGYMLKGLADCGANRYEVKKFGSVCVNRSLFFADSCWEAEILNRVSVTSANPVR